MANGEAALSGQQQLTPTPEAKVLPDCPTDGITRLAYLPSGGFGSASGSEKSKSLLVSTSWDGCVRVHDTTTKTLQMQHSMSSGPLFSLAVTGNEEDKSNGIITGGMDGSVRLLELGALTPLLVGKHETNTTSTSTSISESLSSAVVACSCVQSLGSAGGSQLIASAGWDKQVHIWDTRQQNAVCSVDLPGKAFAMDVDSNKSLLAVGCSGRRTCFLDIRYPKKQPRTIDGAELVLDRESSLKFQTRCLKFFPNGQALAVGSIEGRVAVEYLDELGRGSGNKKFAFKCHRQGDLVYPVNAIEFHPKFGTFATGGCDGTVVLWDGLNKKKLTALPRFPTSIAALAFNNEGTELAIASSYTFEEGEREHPKDEIFVRPVLESECRPKSK